MGKAEKRRAAKGVSRETQTVRSAQAQATAAKKEVLNITRQSEAALVAAADGAESSYAGAVEMQEEVGNQLDKAIGRLRGALTSLTNAKEAVEGRGFAPPSATSPFSGHLDTLRAQLDASIQEGEDKDATIAELQASLETERKKTRHVELLLKNEDGIPPAWLAKQVVMVVQKGVEIPRTVIGMHGVAQDVYDAGRASLEWALRHPLAARRLDGK